MRGLCAPAEQGNKEDGIWLEYKEVTRLKRIAVTYAGDVARARFIGVIIGLAIGFLFTATLHLGAGQ